MKLLLVSFLVWIVNEAYLPPRCHHPIRQGPCDSWRLRYAYDKTKGKCVLFMYGGCDPSANNFKTMQECTKECNPLRKY
ncbi:Kunitz-type proteinase inhibitor AXPI-I [Trichostrongylus colubriformis]|uniref:Kunitz-type proteinase inhibitor AXPI-I n=1 Tax=Trichostrongylus colubriformis TaxID=6319 RepID=A0AAN8EX62_TRICO